MRTEKQQWIEILLVLLTGCLKYVLMDWLNMRAFYIVGISVFWSGYIWHRYSGHHEILKQWGYRKDNFSKSLVVLLPVMLVCIVGSAFYGIFKGKPLMNWHVLPVLLLYPVWGIVQQFMMVSLIDGNLRSLEAFKLKKYQSVLITAFIFSIVHQPYWLLMAITFLLEVVFLLVFHTYRNLWALGLAHGLIGTFLLFYVSNRDLWIELFAWF